MFDWIMETKENTEPIGTPVKIFRRIKKKILKDGVNIDLGTIFLLLLVLLYYNFVYQIPLSEDKKKEKKSKSQYCKHCGKKVE